MNYQLLKLAAAKGSDSPQFSQRLKSYAKHGNLLAQLARGFEEDEQSRFELEIRFNIDTRAALKPLIDAIGQTRTMLEVELTHRRAERARHGERPETWLFLRLHDLYKAVGSDEPLYRFILRQAKAIDPEIALPTAKSFHRRLQMALKRRAEEKSATGK